MEAQQGREVVEKKNKVVLVTGATGQQGSATVRHLLADGWQVKALSRDPNKPAAQRLQQAGAEMVTGDMEDRASLDAVMQGVYGVVSIQPTQGSSSARPGYGLDDEITCGKNVADAARASGVRHFIYPSGSGAGEIQRLRSKWEIEQHLRTLDLPTTILRGVPYMEGYAYPQLGIQRGVLATPIKPDVVQSLITIDDLAEFAVLAFDHPDEYISQTIELAGDALTPPQIAAAISRATGRSIPYVQIPLEGMSQYADYFDWLNTHGCKADIPALRRLHPGLMDFETWLEKEGKTKIEALFTTQRA
jgi:uncharacterized protein YbjT (DUF2867 family)